MIQNRHVNRFHFSETSIYSSIIPGVVSPAGPWREHQRPHPQGQLLPLRSRPLRPAAAEARGALLGAEAEGLRQDVVQEEGAGDDLIAAGQFTHLLNRHLNR